MLKEIDERRTRNSGNEEENTDLAEYLVELEAKARELDCESLSALIETFINLKEQNE